MVRSDENFMVYYCRDGDAIKFLDDGRIRCGRRLWV
jgi:hypothetical protein